MLNRYVICSPFFNGGRYDQDSAGDVPRANHHSTQQGVRLMTRMHCALAVTVCGLLLAAWTSVAQEEPAKGTGDVIKEKADAAVKRDRKSVV